MKVDLVPMKVILKRRANGEADWPDFNSVASSLRGHKPWSKFIDSEGIGWIYDKIENLGTGALNGVACTLIPEGFANAAVTLFPSLVSIIDEATFEAFHDTRAMIRTPIEHLDTEILQGIVARKQLEDLGIAPAPSAEIEAARVKCLDPNDQDHRGVRKNLKKKWVDNKKELDVEILPIHAKA